MISMTKEKASGVCKGSFTITLGDDGRGFSQSRTFTYDGFDDLQETRRMIMAYADGARAALDVQRNQNPVGIDTGDYADVMIALAKDRDDGS